MTGRLADVTRTIEYRGSYDRVDVPTFGIRDLAADTPVDVPDDVAADLTIGGTSGTWFDITEEG